MFAKVQAMCRSSLPKPVPGLGKEELICLVVLEFESTLLSLSDGEPLTPGMDNVEGEC